MSFLKIMKGRLTLDAVLAVIGFLAFVVSISHSNYGASVAWFIAFIAQVELYVVREHLVISKKEAK